MQQGDVMNQTNEIAPHPECDNWKATGAPGKAWDVEIDVHLLTAGPNPDFEIHTHLPTDPNGHIIFENKHRPGFNIHFNLVDRTGSNPPYTFPPQSKVREACWSKVGNTCPKSAAWEVFEPRHVEDHNKTLKVFNPNPCPALGEFMYTLRVTADGGTTYCELDPGGVDKNGATV